MKASHRSSYQDSSSLDKPVKLRDSSKRGSFANDSTRITKSSNPMFKKKQDNASGNNNTETTLNSQFLKDNSSKEGDSRGAFGTPTRASFHDKFFVQTQKKRTVPSLGPLSPSEWEKVFEVKQSEIKSLKNVNSTTNSKIEEAMEFLSRQKSMSEAIVEKDAVIGKLQTQLKTVLNEINSIKMCKKSNSIAHMFNPYENKAPKESMEKKPQVQKIKSLSPRGHQLEVVDERYKMYAENPLQKMIKVRKKKSVQYNHNYNISSSHRNEPRSLDYEKFFARDTSLNSLGPLSPNSIKSGPASKVVIPVKVPENKVQSVQSTSNRAEPRTDIVKDFNQLLDKFSRVIMKYQKETEDLTQKNMDLINKLNKEDAKTNS